MQVPSILQGESLKRMLQGAAVGAVATIVLGFYWGGWTLGGTAKEMAQKMLVPLSWRPSPPSVWTSSSMPPTPPRRWSS